MHLTRLFPLSRSSLVAMAGPLMIVTTITAWIGLFILGFALIYWPYLHYFRSDDEFVVLGFIHALYFSGGTATVLGFGDISPLSGALQVISFIQAGLGFALLTGILTYLINVVSGVSERNALALRLWTITGCTGDGTVAVVRALKHEEIADLRLRLQSLHDVLYIIHQKMYQFPILDLFYRSHQLIYSPEYMIRSAAQIAIASQILATAPTYRRLTNVAEELGEVSLNLMILITQQHLSNVLMQKLKYPEPEMIDEQQLQEIQTILSGTNVDLKLSDLAPNRKTLELICRLRVFLKEADEFTSWRMDE